MDFDAILNKDEKILWQGRPAPRCFTFRNWQHSIFGVIILIASIFWLLYGLKLGSENQQVIYGLIPVPFLVAGIYLAFGHLILARLEWEHVFYVMTNHRLITVRGLFSRKLKSLDLEEVVWFQLNLHGEQLGTVRVRSRDLDKKAVISCVEYPQKLTELLESSMENNGIDVTARPGV